MTYRHDVFISYRRQELWTPWVRDHFNRLLIGYLQQELGRAPSIFVDERIEPGADWVDELGDNLARSKIMVAVFSKDYFGSAYCLAELDMMWERSKLIANGGPHPCRLIVPVVVHDGECIPVPIQRVQPSNFKDFRVAEITPQTELYQRFSQAMLGLAPSILSAINSAPQFDATWIDPCKAHFQAAFVERNGGEVLALKNFQRPNFAPPNSPPRLKI